MTNGADWTDEELKAAVSAYLEMLDHQENGKHYNKAEYRHGLVAGPLSSRTESSVEYRMQNISAAMEELCLPVLSGYLPAKNVGNNVKDRIKRCVEKFGTIHQDDYAPESDDRKLQEKTERLLRRRLVGKPRGQLTPKRMNTTSQAFQRDPLVRAWVYQQAKGVCDCCGKEAPFKLFDGSFYLEVHHVKPLAEGGSDRVENSVAVCPNCHRALHLAEDKERLREGLLGRVSRLMRE